MIATASTDSRATQERTLRSFPATQTPERPSGGTFHACLEEMVHGLAHIKDAPKTCGTLEMIVLRPAPGERRCVEEAILSPTAGVHGDRWLTTCRHQLPDGSPDPGWQVTIVNARAIQLMAGRRSLWPLSGDNLF